MTSGDLHNLVARVAVLEAELAIKRLFLDYAEALDYGEQDRFVDCFVEDGSWEAKRGTDASRLASGSLELLEVVRRHTRAPNHYHKHVVVNTRITLELPTARATSYFVRLETDDDGGPSYIWAMGRYLDRLVLCRDGRWRFSSRFLDIEDRHPAAVRWAGDTFADLLVADDEDEGGDP